MYLRAKYKKVLGILGCKCSDTRAKGQMYHLYLRQKKHLQALESTIYCLTSADVHYMLRCIEVAKLLAFISSEPV
jgi:hypothetical protein